MRHIPLPVWENPPPTKKQLLLAETFEIVRKHGSTTGLDLLDEAYGGGLSPISKSNQKKRTQRKKSKSSKFKMPENTGDMFAHTVIGDTGETGGKNQVLATPKLFLEQHKGESQPAKLDNLIFTGFTDHDLRNKAEAGLEDVSAFLNLPGGGIVPAAKDALLALAEPRKKMLLDKIKFENNRNCDFVKLQQDFYRVNQNIKNMDKDIKLMAKAHKSSEKKRARKIRQEDRFLEVKYGVTSPTLDKYRLKMKKQRNKKAEAKTKRLKKLEAIDNGEKEDNSASLGGTKKEKRERMQRQREERERKARYQRKLRRKQRRNESYATKSFRSADSLYSKQKKQIATAIALRKEKDDTFKRNEILRKHGGGGGSKQDLLSSQMSKNQSRIGRTMEHYYMYHRNLTDAAVTIQRKYRKAARIAYWKRHAWQSKAAKTIQRFARGGLTRTMVARWWARRNYLVCKMQAIMRGYFGRVKYDIVRKREYNAAVTIQRCTRGWLGRCNWDLAQMTKACTDIQRIWRGGSRLCGRALADKLWLNGHVLKMQRVGRKFIHGRVGVKRIHKEMNDAVVAIQRCFRGWMANNTRNRLLRNRSVLQRVLQVNILRSEAVYVDDVVTELKRDLENAELGDRLKSIEKEEAHGRRDCYQIEFDYQAFIREKRRLSPRAIAQGFVKNIDKNIDTYREKITKSKLKMLFDIGRESRRLHALQKKADKLFQKYKFEQEIYSKWREEDMDVHWQNVAVFKKQNREKKARMAISEQKRKWSIRFYTENGKPDRKRRYGRPWHSSVYADPNKLRYTMTGEFWTDFSSYENLIKLQNTLNAYQYYGASMKPLMDEWNGFEKSLAVAGTEADKERIEKERRLRRKELIEELRQKEIEKEMREDEKEKKAAEERQKRREERQLTRSQIAEEAKKLYKPRSQVWNLLDDLDMGKNDLQTEMRIEREEEIRKSFKKKSKEEE